MNNEWISVDERLPEIPPKFYDKEGGYWVTPLSVQIICFNGEDVFEGTYHNTEKFSSTYFTKEDVTHWMVLPSPPKQ